MGDRIRHAMTLRGVTRADVVSAGILSKQGVSQWLNGTAKPDKVRAETVAAWCKFLRVSREWLLWGRGSMEPQAVAEATAPYGSGLADRLQDAEETMDGLQVVMTTVLQAMARLMPDAAPGLLAALQGAAPQVSGSQRQVVEAAVAAVTLGLQPAARAGRRASPASPSENTR